MQQDNATSSAESEKEFMGRTSKEWLALMPAFGSIVLIVFGALYASDCTGIPSLPAFAITFGALSVLNGLVPFLFRTEKAKAADGDGGVPAHVGSVVGLSLIGCAIWGAVITWGETSRLGSSPDCNIQLYTAGFISSVIPLAIITVMLVSFFIMKLVKKGGSNATEQTKEGKDEDLSTAQEEQASNAMAQP